MRMRISNRALKINDDGTMTYRGKTQPVKGATATYTESQYRKGIPYLTRKTIRTFTVTVNGPEFQIIGTVRPLGARGLAGRFARRSVQNMVMAINDAGRAGTP